MIKRALAAALCLMLVLALLPKTTRASDGVQTTLDIRVGSIKIGDGSVSGYATDGSHVTDHDPDGYEIIGRGSSTTNTVTVTGGTPCG